MIGDAKKILGFLVMPSFTHAGIFSLALDSAIRSFHCEGIVTGGTRFRPPFFTLEKNGVIFSAFGFHGNFSGFIIRLFGAGGSLDREFPELPGSVGINRFSAPTVNIHEGEQNQYQNSSDTGCGNFHGITPRRVKSVYL